MNSDTPITDPSAPHMYASILELQKQVLELDRRMDKQHDYLQQALEDAKRDREAIRGEIIEQGERSRESIQAYHDNLLSAIKGKRY